MATRSTNTMSEGLAALVQQIGAMKMMPDADDEFLNALEGAIIDYARSMGARAMAGQQLGQMPGTGMGSPNFAMPGSGGLPQGSVPTPGGAPPAGVMPGASVPPDAIRQMMEAGAAPAPA